MMGKVLSAAISSIIDEELNCYKQDIFQGIQYLPDNLINKGILTVLHKIIPDPDQEAQTSRYSSKDKVIYIKTPFNFNNTIYSAMDKAYEAQRYLMDLGTIAGLYFLSKNKGNPAVQKIIEPLNAMIPKLSITDSSKLSSLDIATINTTYLKNILSLVEGRHIMAGISDINCHEPLLQWTIRHEIGHAVDNLIRWSADKQCENPIFGGWKYYKDASEAHNAYKTDGGSEQDLKIFQSRCIDYPFTYDTGGEAQGNTRIFMLDEYGEWCSYLKEARKNAVSNYQFASKEEWFAEAFAATYGPSLNFMSPIRALIE